MSNLTLLSHLNLFCTNLSGRIPSLNQLDTLEAHDPTSMYIDNPLVFVGIHFQMYVLEISRYRKNHSNANEDDNIQMDFHLGLTVGFLVGLRIIFCVFCLRRLGYTRISAYLTNCMTGCGSFLYAARYKLSKHYIYGKITHNLLTGLFPLIVEHLIWSTGLS